jgi:sugar/nucleoside kinase (ribokinase family)
MFKPRKVKIQITDKRPPVSRRPASKKAKKEKVPLIAGAGVSCLDHIFVSRQIRWGESAPVESYSLQGGGLVGTALVACARLGARCRLYSFLSHDEAGTRIAAELAREGIRLDGVAAIPGGASPFSFIHVDSRSGERTIFHRRARGLEKARLPDLSGISECQALLVDDYYPELALAAARIAKSNGIPVVADVTTNPDWSAEFFRQVSVLIAPLTFAGRFGLGDDLGAALEAFRGLGPETVVFTLGADGWAFAGPGGRGRGKAFSVDVVDTTGAGDAFHGAFAYGLARGWDIERCAEFAGAVAAIKCTRAGGREGLPTLSQALEFLRHHGRLKWPGPSV